MAKAISTIRLLEKLGFVPAATTGQKSLLLQTDVFELMVSNPPNPNSCACLEVLGSFYSLEHAGVIAFHVPKTMACDEQGMAWLSDGIGLPAQVRGLPDWFYRGLDHRHLMPISGICFRDPGQRCVVERDTARLLRSLLRTALECAAHHNRIAVLFDGRILRFDTADKQIEVVATGRPWKYSVSVDACCLAQLPIRFRDDRVTVKVVRGNLVFEGKYSQIRAVEQLGG